MMRTKTFTTFLLWVLVYNMMATYVSVWEDGVEVRTECEYDPDTKIVTDIEPSDVEVAGNLEDEFVELPNGDEFREDDGVTFEY